MTWQWTVIIVAILLWIVALKYLANKQALGNKGLQMMDENNVLLQQYLKAQGEQQ